MGQKALLNRMHTLGATRKATQGNVSRKFEYIQARGCVGQRLQQRGCIFLPQSMPHAARERQAPEFGVSQDLIMNQCV
jgi:hypothetical protein